MACVGDATVVHVGVGDNSKIKHVIDDSHLTMHLFAALTHLVDEVEVMFLSFQGPVL
jgi:hypothetical protein